jgi:hypothetical protein
MSLMVLTNRSNVLPTEMARMTFWSCIELLLYLMRADKTRGDVTPNLKQWNVDSVVASKCVSTERCLMESNGIFDPTVSKPSVPDKKLEVVGRTRFDGSY